MTVPLAVEHEIADARDGAGYGCVDRRTRGRADVEPTRGRPLTARELVVRDAALVVAGEPVDDAGEQTLVDLPADRLERERKRIGAVIAERRHRLL